MSEKSTASGIDQEGSTARTESTRDTPLHEINARVALEIMGWTSRIYNDSGWTNVRLYSPPGLSDSIGQTAANPYSSDVAYAFKVLAKLEPHCDDIMIGVQRGVWEAEIAVSGEAYLAGFRSAIYSAPTPALAICLAALAATRSVPSSVVLAVDPSWSTPKTDSVAAALPVSERREGTNG